MSDYRYDAVLHRVVDGDTVWLNVDLGFRVHVIMDFRLAGIDCPELVTLEGVQARNATIQWFADHPNITVTSTRTDRYGRWLGIIEDVHEADTLNDWLIENGYGRPYDGGKRV